VATLERWNYYILDVFTDRPLAGNQLAVFEEAPDIPETLLQPLAKEIGFAETVFLYPAKEGNEARMRIFTPENEIPFAGHPTLGAATVVAHRLGKDRVVLETGRGPVPVRIERTIGRASQGAMDQPIPSFALYAHENALLRALGAQHSRLPVTVYDNGIPHVYVLLDHPDEVAALQPDLAALTRLAQESGAPIVGFNVFAGADAEWKTRMFAPADGIPEDPATGSAAGPLALHLARHGLIPWSTQIHITQGEEIGRPSSLFAMVVGSADHVERIEVSGSVVPVGGGWFDGNLLRAASGA
jgi:trans-2,3-dihydro-3-hydroxyanthranilate isomerase